MGLRRSLIAPMVLLVAIAGAPVAASAQTSPVQTASRPYPPPGHMMIFSDREADRLEFHRKHAVRDGKTLDAIALTWQLGARIDEVWGAHQTIQWEIYMGVVELWRGIAEHDKAIAVLERMNDELGRFHWFDNYERAGVRLTQAYVFVDDARPGDAERAFRQYLALYAASEQPAGPVTAEVYRDFAAVLQANGKEREANEMRRLAASADRG